MKYFYVRINFYCKRIMGSILLDLYAYHMTINVHHSLLLTSDQQFIETPQLILIQRNKENMLYKPYEQTVKPKAN